MSLFGRMNTILQSKMSSVLDQAEDPNETLDYSYEKQLQLLQNVQRSLADLVTSKRRLQLQHDRAQTDINGLDDQAKQALLQNREDLARNILERKVAAQEQLHGLDDQITQLQAQQDKLNDAEQRLKTKVEAFRTTKESLKAQYTASEAQVKINEAATGISEEMADVGLAVERAQDKTEQMQARAAAMDDLQASGALPDVTQEGSDDIDRKLLQGESQVEVDKQLSAMKKQLTADGQPGAQA